MNTGMPVNVPIIQLLSESSPSTLMELNVNERIPLYCKYFLLTILHISFYLSAFYYVSVYFPRFHNKFTIRSTKEVFSFASGKRCFFNHFRAINYVLQSELPSSCTITFVIVLVCPLRKK